MFKLNNNMKNKKFTNICNYLELFLIYYYSSILICTTILVFLLLKDSNVIYCDSVDGSDIYYQSSTSLVDPSSENISQSGKPLCNNENNLHSPFYLNPYSKFKNNIRCEFYWFFLEKEKGRFDYYRDFKSSWDPNTKVLSAMKKQLNEDINSVVHKTKVVKRVVRWLIKPSSRRPNRPR